MSKLAHSNESTMAEIERQARDGRPNCVICPRCKQGLDSPDEAEACEDFACPYIGGAK